MPNAIIRDTHGGTIGAPETLFQGSWPWSDSWKMIMVTTFGIDYPPRQGMGYANTMPFEKQNARIRHATTTRAPRHAEAKHVHQTLTTRRKHKFEETEAFIASAT